MKCKPCRQTMTERDGVFTCPACGATVKLLDIASTPERNPREVLRAASHR